MIKVEEYLFCSVCEERFVPKTSRQVYCSRACNNKAQIRKIRRICKNCGTEYAPKRWDAYDFCSRECAFELKTKVSRARKALRNIAKNNKPKMVAVCDICGKGFISGVRQNVPRNTTDKWNAISINHQRQGFWSVIYVVILLSIRIKAILCTVARVSVWLKPTPREGRNAEEKPR